MKQKLIIVTGNPMKFEQLALGLSELFDCEQGTMEGYEIQGTPEEILEHKLRGAYEKYKQPVLVDDVSLHLESLGGFPGPYIRSFLGSLDVWKMGEKFEGDEVSAVCRLGLYLSDDRVIIGQGMVKGKVIKPEQSDKNGWDFDVFLLPEGLDKTMSEFSLEEKNKFSHRGNAMRHLIKKLKESDL